MALSIVCPGCDSDYNVPESLLGKTIRCKKCGETVDVKARPKVKAARRVDDDDDDVRPRKAVRRRDDEDDDYDDTPRKKKGGMSPAVIGGIAAAVLAVGGVGGYFAFSGEKPPEPQPVAQSTGTPTPGRGRTVPAEDDKKPDDAVKTEPKKEEPKKEEPKVEEKKPEPKVEPAKAETKPATETKPTTETNPKPTPAGNEAPKKPDNQLRQLPGVVTSQGGTENGLSWREYMSGQMDPVTLERVKAASVFIICENPGISWGSGWFGLEPDLVFTNAHVIDMIAPNTPPPKKLTFVLNAGTPKERTIPNTNIKLLAVDREIDLAVLRVINEKDLPPPLKVRFSAECMEGLKLHTIGYPRGGAMAQIGGQSSGHPTVSIRPTAVTAHRRNNFGQLRRVQFEGGSNPGNSGGPLVDAEGTVCTMCVEGVIQSSGAAVSLGVPTEYVFGAIAGRISETLPGMAYNDGEKVRIPIKIKCLDAMDRLQSVGVAAWIGNKAEKPRYPGTEKPPAQPGDRDYAEIELKYDKKTKTAEGEIIMPRKPEGTVYWLQPFYSNPMVPRYWQPGFIYNRKGDPADRVEVTLAYKPPIGRSRVVTMTHTSDLSEDDEGEGQSKMDTRQFKFGLTVTEDVLAPGANNSDAAARLRMKFNDMLMPKVVEGGSEEDAIRPASQLIKFNEEIRKCGAIALINKVGEAYKVNIDTMNIQDPQIRGLVTMVSKSAVDAVTGTSIAMPNASMKPSGTWVSNQDKIIIWQEPPPRDQRGRPIPGAKQPPPRSYAIVEVNTMKYVGVRVREGRKEAVVEIDGTIKPGKGSSNKATGFTRGYAYVELETGVVVDATIEQELHIDSSSQGRKRHITGYHTYTISRTSAN